MDEGLFATTKIELRLCELFCYQKPIGLKNMNHVYLLLAKSIIIQVTKTKNI
jgi:hypothetical protein